MGVGEDSLAKNIVVFMDGTRNKPSDRRVLTDTNVWKLYEAASSSHKGHESHAKYIRGVGTERKEQVTSPADDLRLHRIREWNPPAHPAKRASQIVARISKRVALKYGASAVGWGVADRIREAYEFICRHYDPGDQVFLFGFSRGAFEARSLAGFVDSVGLLLKSQATGPDARRLVDKAYEIYRRGDEESLFFLRKFLRRVVRLAVPGPATDFRPSTEVRLHFVGVWDTVEALGIGEVKLGPLVLKNKSLPVVGKHTAYHLAKALPQNVQHGRHALAIHELRTKFEPLLWDGPFPGQDSAQVWFAGAHADVGGGYPDTLMSDIALSWMADEACRCSSNGPSLVFNGVPPPSAHQTPLAPHHAIQGDFFWATPAQRDAVSNFASHLPEVTATFSVHQSAVQRLFSSDATAYGIYPFEKDYKWTKHLPGGRNYPNSVAEVLSALDDLTVRLHVATVMANDVKASVMSSANSTSRIGNSSAPPSWRGTQTVEGLLLAETFVSTLWWDLDQGDAVVPTRLADALALLFVFGHVSAIEDFVSETTARARELAQEAGQSAQSGSKVRKRWLQNFHDLCEAAHIAASLCPALCLAEAGRIRHEVCKARADLWETLPIDVFPEKAIFKIRPPKPPAGSDPTP
jgi:uncharacterized protein (DUF2235 family)